MLNISTDTLRSIEAGATVWYDAVLYMRDIHRYTPTTGLVSIGDISGQLTDITRYELGNTTVTIENRDNELSRLFAHELPIRSVMEIIMMPFEVTVFRGIVDYFTLTETAVTFYITF